VGVRKSQEGIFGCLRHASWETQNGHHWKLQVNSGFEGEVGVKEAPPHFLAPKDNPQLAEGIVNIKAKPAIVTNSEINSRRVSYNTPKFQISALKPQPQARITSGAQ
jgi:hypothetical protein